MELDFQSLFFKTTREEEIDILKICYNNNSLYQNLKPVLPNFL